MKFLTDVTTQRFICIECHGIARIVTLEGMKVAWCDTFECGNTNSLISLGDEWQEFEHKDLFDIDQIQGLMFKEFFVNSWVNRGLDNASKSPRPRAHLTLMTPRIKT
jgi:hypothetical protein